MAEALSESHHKTRKLILLVVCGLFAIAAAIAGIDDNPPGILLAYLGAIAFVLAFVHRWRTARPFMVLTFASILSLVLFIILNNIFAAVAHDSATTGIPQKLLQGFAVTAFFLGTLIFPAAFVVGTVGWIMMFIRERWRRT